MPAVPAATAGSGTAPYPGTAMLPPANAAPKAEAPTELTREPARDTLAPSSFGTIGGTNKPATAPAPAAMRGARPPLNTLGELEGLSATATLRPPGAVPPPPRALPMATPTLDAQGLDRDSDIGPAPAAPDDTPFTALAGNLPPRGFENATVVSGGVATKPAALPVPASLDSTLDMQSTASKKATQAALIEATRISGPTAGAAPPPAPATTSPAAGVPAPGLYIADEPLEPRPKQASMVTIKREDISRLRGALLVSGGLLLMLAGALVVMIFRRSESNAERAAAASASAQAAPPPGCALATPASRISPIERSVPISALPQADGNLALAVADTKTSAIGWLYDPQAGEVRRTLPAPSGTADISHVSAGDPVLVDRSSPDFAFAQTLAPGLALGVGPAGLLRRGDDGGAGVVWALGAGVRVTPPRVVSTAEAHFVAFRQGGAEGQLMAGWLKADGSAAGDPYAIEGAPKSLGTPNVAPLGRGAVVLFAARGEKSEPYRIYAATAQPFEKPTTARVLDLPSDGGGAIAPSLAALPGGRYLAQWTDGNIGQYQVHARLLDSSLNPQGDALLISAKGANAGQGTVVTTPKGAVSFFIQTTAGHDELWGVTLTCH